MISPTRETHIPIKMCFPYPGTHIPSDMYSPTRPRKEHISQVICVVQPVKHIPLVICVTLHGKHKITSDTSSPSQETHITSDMCSRTRETHITSDMWYLRIFKNLCILPLNDTYLAEICKMFQ